MDLGDAETGLAERRAEEPQETARVSAVPSEKQSTKCEMVEYLQANFAEGQSFTIEYTGNIFRKRKWTLTRTAEEWSLAPVQTWSFGAVQSESLVTLFAKQSNVMTQIYQQMIIEGAVRAWILEEEAAFCRYTTLKSKHGPFVAGFRRFSVHDQIEVLLPEARKVHLTSAQIQEQLVEQVIHRRLIVAWIMEVEGDRYTPLWISGQQFFLGFRLSGEKISVLCPPYNRHHGLRPREVLKLLLKQVIGKEVIGKEVIGISDTESGPIPQVQDDSDVMEFVRSKDHVHLRRQITTMLSDAAYLVNFDNPSDRPGDVVANQVAAGKKMLRRMLRSKLY